MKYTLRGSTNEDLIERIFENRKVDIEKRNTFLKPSASCVMNPLVYDNMDLGFELYNKHLQLGNKILYVVDSDADGYCSSATMINYTRKTLGYNNIVYVMHDTKKHGLTKEILAEIYVHKPSLVVVADAGSADYEAHKELASKGIDLLIIDHHECEKYSEHAVVINNQLSENGNKTLSGAGMVLKFLEYLDMRYEIDHTPYYYDLVAIALVADGMAMTEEETRYYVLEGLDNIYNPFLQSLTGGSADGTFEYIGYNVAPNINAIIRVGDEKTKRDLFDAMICEDRMEIIKLRGKGDVEMPLPQYIMKMADRLKSKQTREVKKILDAQDTIVVTENYPVTFLIHENDDAQALSGLIANRLVDKYNKPALVLMKKEQIVKDGEDEIVKVRYDGSARSTSGFKNFKDYLDRTNKFIYCAGHQGAFGISINSKEFSELMTILMYQSLPNEEACMVDKAYLDGKVTATEILAVGEMKDYWCKGFEKPVFYIKLKNVDASDIVTMGTTGNTIKITSNYINYIKFRCTNEELNSLLSDGQKDIELIGTFNINDWNGRSFPQVIIEDIEIKESEENLFEGFDFSNFNAFGI